MNDKELMNIYSKIELSADRMAEMEGELMKKFDPKTNSQDGYVDGGKPYKVTAERKSAAPLRWAIGLGSAAAVVLCVFGLSRLGFGTIPHSPADTVSYAEGEYPLLSGTFKQWDNDKVADALLPDYDSTELNQYQDNGAVYYSGKYERLFVSDGNISYHKNIYDVRDFGFGTEVYEVSEGILRSQHPEREFDDFTSEQALKAAEEVIAQLDIPHLGEPQIYAAESTVEEALVAMYADRIAYTEEELAALEGNEVYVIFYPTEYNGVEMPIGEVRFADTDTVGKHGYLEIGVDENGIFEFEAHNIMELAASGDTAEICDRAAARKIASAKLPDGADITDGGLVYVGEYSEDSKTSVFRPAWRFISLLDGEYKSCYISEEKQPVFTTTAVTVDDAAPHEQPTDGEISVAALFENTDGYSWDFGSFEEHFAGVWRDSSGNETIVGYNEDFFDYTGDNQCGGFAQSEDGYFMLQCRAEGKYSVYAALKADNSTEIKRYDFESDTQCVSLDAYSEVYDIYSDAAAVTEFSDSYAGEATLITLTRLMREHFSQYGESNLGEVIGEVIYAPEYTAEDLMVFEPMTYNINGVDYARYTVNGDCGKVWVKYFFEKCVGISLRCYTMEYIEHLRSGYTDESYSGIRAKYIDLLIEPSDDGKWHIKGYDLWENDILNVDNGIGGIVSSMPTPLSEKVKENDSNNSLTSNTRVYGTADTAQYVMRSMLTENTVNVADSPDGKFGSEYYTNGVTEIYYYDAAYNEYYLLDVLVGADMAVIDGKAYVIGGVPDENAELMDIACEEVLCCYDRTRLVGRTLLDCEPYTARKLKAYGECLVATYWKALDNLDYKVFDSVTLTQLCETNYSPMNMNGTGGIEELSEDGFVVKLAGANEIRFDGEHISGELLLLNSRAQAVYEALVLGEVSVYCDGSINMEGFETLSEARKALSEIYTQEYADGYLEELLKGCIEERNGYLYYTGSPDDVNVMVVSVIPHVESIDGNTAVISYLVTYNTDDGFIKGSFRGYAENTADGWRLTAANPLTGRIVEIPALMSTRVEEALYDLNSLGLVVTVLYEENSDIDNGCVIRSEPAAGELALQGSEVVLVVSYAQSTN